MGGGFGGRGGGGGGGGREVVRVDVWAAMKAGSLQDYPQVQILKSLDMYP